MKVSVYIPAYNQEELIIKALDSIPIRDDLEVIVIDDCSTDKTLENVLDYQKKSKLNMKVLQNESNKGVGYTNNVGLDNSIGEYVYELDCDDCLFTDEFNKVIDQLDGTDIVYVNAQINDGFIFRLCEENKHHYCAGWTHFLRKEFLGNERRPLKNLFDDLELNERLLAKQHTEKFTDITCYRYNFPREGSIIWQYDHRDDRMENIFYFNNINAMGGTEQFLYEIAKRYHDIEITIFYSNADPKQLRRMKQFVPCRQYVKGQKYRCRKAFFSYSLDMIDDIEAEEYWFISHAIYQELGYNPPFHPKLTHYIGVSEYAADKLEEFGRLLKKDVKAEVCYNPLTIEPKKKVVRLISAARLDDKVKGGQRILWLIKALDDYCAKNDRQYLWTIFTNQVQFRIGSPNVCLMQPRIDIRPYIADSDYLVQLSNDMETYCYSINEALCYGVPVVTTPLTVLKEFDLSDEMHIECAWDMSNASDVARQIFERERKPFVYSPPEDRWREILSNKPSLYKAEDYLIKVRATDQWKEHVIVDKETGIIPDPGYEWIVEKERYVELLQFEEKNGISLIEKA